MALLGRGPQSVGELLDLAVAVTKRHLGSLLALGAPPLAIAIALGGALRLRGAGPEAELLALVPMFVCFGVAEARMIVAVWQILHQQPINQDVARAQVRLRFPAVVLGYTVKWTLAWVGFFLLVVPGVLVLLWCFAVPTVTLLEREGLRGGIRRSRALARGQTRRLLSTLGVFDLATIGFFFGFTMLYADPQTGKLPLWADATTWTLTILLMPVRAALMTVVYADTRVRSEGYDVEAVLAA